MQAQGGPREELRAAFARMLERDDGKQIMTHLWARTHTMPNNDPHSAAMKLARMSQLIMIERLGDERE